MAQSPSSPGRFGGTALWLESPPDTAATGAVDVLTRATAAVGAAERVGITTVWVTESPCPAGADTPYEAYSLLGALAVPSTGARLGVVADGAERRAPSILAKIVTGVDVISHGRAVLALDGDCGAPGDAERLSEALTVCRSVLVDEHPTFAGRIYSVDDAVNRPAPVQAGGVPLVVFLHGDGPGWEPLLDVAARLADAVVVDGRADRVAEVRRTIGERADRDDHPGGGVEVLARIGSDGGGRRAADAVAGVRAAGADGCLVGIPFPWDPAAVEALATSW